MENEENTRKQSLCVSGLLKFEKRFLGRITRMSPNNLIIWLCFAKTRLLELMKLFKRMLLGYSWLINIVYILIGQIRRS